MVQVTDADQPGEGTGQAQVALTQARGYNPRAGLVDPGSEPAAGSPARLELTGWRPALPVQVTLTDDADRTVFSTRVTPGPDGSATLSTGVLRSGYHQIHASDGLWVIGGDEAVLNGAYSDFVVTD